MTHLTQKKNTKTHDLGNTRSRSWVFTFNNYTENDIISLLTQFTPSFLYRFQEEIGKNNTAHLQGVVKFNNAKTFKSMKKINQKIHWEKCNNIKASILYCSKTDTKSGRSWEKNIEKYIPITNSQRKKLFEKWLTLYKSKVLTNMKKNIKFL